MFSLVIPTRDRAEILIQALVHLESLTYPRSKFEVIVVNDGSQDNTRSSLEKLEVGYRLRVLHHKQGRGTSAARNLAISEATGSHVLFIDDDVFPCADLLEHHEEGHRGHLRRLVRGPVINIDSLPLPTDHPRLLAHYSQNYLCTSNASLRKSLLCEAGLFDVDFPRWEDAELGVRLKKLGVRRHFVLNGYVYHLKPRLSTDHRLVTAQRDGASAALLYQRYPSFRMKLRSGLHPANYLRSGLLTVGPLRRAYASYLEKQPTGKFAPLAESLLAEREYLKSGRDVLKSHPGTEQAPSS